MAIPPDCVTLPFPLKPIHSSHGFSVPPLRLYVPLLPALYPKYRSPTLLLPPDWTKLPVPDHPTCTSLVVKRLPPVITTVPLAALLPSVSKLQVAPGCVMVAVPPLTIHAFT